jgi:hypothetical protein
MPNLDTEGLPWEPDWDNPVHIGNLLSPDGGSIIITSPTYLRHWEDWDRDVSDFQGVVDELSSGEHLGEYSLKGSISTVSQDKGKYTGYGELGKGMGVVFALPDINDFSGAPVYAIFDKHSKEVYRIIIDFQRHERDLFEPMEDFE